MIALNKVFSVLKMAMVLAFSFGVLPALCQKKITVVGTVTDSSHAPLANVSITVVSLGTFRSSVQFSLRKCKERAGTPTEEVPTCDYNKAGSSRSDRITGMSSGRVSGIRLRATYGGPAHRKEPLAPPGHGSVEPRHRLLAYAAVLSVLVTTVQATVALAAL